jgi:hypothetical protein
VCDRSATQAFENLLQNGGEVADALRVCRALSCLVLSGHTHELFPASGTLPDRVSNASHRPLHNNHAQLTIGTVSQRDSTQTWQRLRIAEEDHTGQVWLERVVYERTKGQGEFDPISAHDNSDVAEHMRLI